MKSKTIGPNISNKSVEVTNVSRNGLWLIVRGKEYFLSYKDFPWFKAGTIEQILNVKLIHKTHLHWLDLDVDLDVKTLENLEAYPLVYKP